LTWKEQREQLKTTNFLQNVADWAVIGICHIVTDFREAPA